MGIPAKTKYPAAKIIGIRLGNILIRPIRTEKNIKPITMLINIKANPKPLNKSRMR